MGRRECCFKVLLYAVVVVEAVSVLMCSKCESDGEGDCMKIAPPPTPCEPIKGGAVNCVITRKADITGSTVKFSRGCTSVVVSSGCTRQMDNITLCFFICDTDNCNVAPALDSISITVTILLATLILCLGI